MFFYFIIGAIIGLAIVITNIYKKESTMTDHQVQEAKAADVKQDIPQHNVVYDVLIANSHKIGDKLLGLLTWLIGKEDDHGVLSIVFTDEYPKTAEGENVLSRFHADSRSIVVNLLGHFEMAQEKVKESNCYMGFWAYLWQQVVRSIYHEIKHAEDYSDADSIYDIDEMNPDLEARAEEYAKDMLYELAKVVDVEPPPIEEFPYYSEMVMAELERIVNIDDPSAPEEIQQICFAENLVYYRPGVGVGPALKITTLREYFKELAGDDDARWEAPVPTMKAMVEEQEPVKAPVVPVPLATTDAPEVWKAHMDTQLAAEDTPLPYLGVEGDEGCPFNPFEDEDVVVVDEPALHGMSQETIDTVREMSTFAKEVSVQQLPPKQESKLVFDDAKPKKAAPTTVFPVPTTPETFVNTFGASSGAPAPQPVKQLEPHSLTIEQQKAILQAVLTRLYVHIFSKCGFAPGSDSGFTNAAGVIEPVYIGDIPGASDLFHSMDTVEDKTLSEKRITDTIVGRVLPKSGLPGYHLYLNIRGMKAKRSFIPQNPNKMNNGVLSKWAEKARAGHCIAMLTQEGKGIRVDIQAAPGGQLIYTPDRFKN